MADLLGRSGASRAKVSETAPPWWPGRRPAGAGETLVRVSFWVSALGQVLDAIEAAARETGIAPSIAGLGRRGCPLRRLRRRGEPAACAGFTGALRGALDQRARRCRRAGAPGGVRAALAGRGGMAGSVPGCA